MKTSELKALLADMTLEEKIGQLVQLPGEYLEEDRPTGPESGMDLRPEEITLAGSYLSVVGAEKLRRVQRAHMERHPHHIPLLFMADIINGYRTVFPIPLAQACTFHPALVEDCTAIAAREAAAAGVQVTFSPMADLVRDPRWGRVMESPGEDPLLCGRMAAAMVRGYQGADLREKGRIAACLKHFAGYGAPDGGRDYNTVELSPRTLREDYLPAYAAAVAAGCELVMSSFNTLDRVPSAVNVRLLRDILRGEMGFEGAVITDWNALQELLAHGVAENEAEAACLGIRAGVDIDMNSPVYCRNLAALVRSGRVPEAWIDEAALRVLTLKNKLGLFESPYKDADAGDEQALLLSPAHRSAARTCAEESFVLLKNEDHILPLSGDRIGKTALIGPWLSNPALNGAWSIFADDGDCVTVQSALLNDPRTARCPTAPGCALTGPDYEDPGFGERVLRPTPENALAEAVALAREAETVVLLLGEDRSASGEAASRAKLTLPACQLELLDRVAAVNPNVAVVLFTGRPLDLRAVARKAKAILLAWLPGTEGGPAVLRTLLGDCSPAGKLSMSFPRGVGQVPVHYSHLPTGRPFSGDPRDGRFFSRYQDTANTPLYPFGFGLTYTRFELSPVMLDRTVLTADGVLHASVEIANTGDRPGTETLQLYLRDLCASVSRPVRELKDFRRVTLAPGERRTVSFEITEPMLRFYDIDMRHVSEPGEFQLFIGADSAAENSARFTLQ